MTHTSSIDLRCFPCVV